MGGDLVDANLGSLNDANLAYGLMLRRYFHSNLAVRANLLRTRLTGNDLRSERLAYRGFRTQTPVTELSADFELDILGHRKRGNGAARGILSPYVFAGVGLAFTNPKTYYGELNSDALLDQNADVSNTRFVMPVGAGLRVNMTPSWALAIELSPRATFSDYLDGVSIAGNPDKNDWYGIGSVQLWYKLSVADRDGDGIVDTEDACPDVAGTELSLGCPDRDNDGVADDRDNCPDIPGIASLNGCPDSDNDGIADAADACPTQAGPAATNGCPDRDGDGLADGVDNCPDQAGPISNLGCPLVDSDNDGLNDDVDNCPNEAGPVANNGCPYTDRDGDGVLDKDDRCPDTKGVASNGGCPEVEIQQEAQDILDFATENVRFATDQAELLTSSYAIMDEVAKVLQAYPSYKLKIEGFTDSRGSSVYNQSLSESRAQRCYQYLLTRGIPASRMQYAGYGESNPIASNDTEAGRLQNRRVEFSVFR